MNEDEKDVRAMAWWGILLVCVVGYLAGFGITTVVRTIWESVKR